MILFLSLLRCSYHENLANEQNMQSINRINIDNDILAISPEISNEISNYDIDATLETLLNQQNVMNFTRFHVNIIENNQELDFKLNEENYNNVEKCIDLQYREFRDRFKYIKDVYEKFSQNTIDPKGIFYTIDDYKKSCGTEIF
ncbi:uncharacterized protein VNE69_08042 [Vairimorpha necatrix]|uniref:Lipoprotein n=1 Tax=Vairimorpha necatrix TaxID=6039 RepID=A0AAX4JE68_9MICR